MFRGEVSIGQPVRYVSNYLEELVSQRNTKGLFKKEGEWASQLNRLIEGRFIVASSINRK